MKTQLKMKITEKMKFYNMKCTTLFPPYNMSILNSIPHSDKLELMRFLLLLIFGVSEPG